MYKTISVVIPLYNKRAHIIETVDTVLAQTIQPLEILVIDDGSTDGGADWLHEERGDRVRIIRQDNAGVSAARNLGIRAALGEYVAFIDADDSWEPHFVEEIIMMILKFPQADIFTTGYQSKYEGDLYVDPKIRWPQRVVEPCILENYFEVSARGELPFVMSGFCARRETLISLGGFPEGEPLGEDQDLFAKAALQSIIAYSPRVLCFYHKDADNRACLGNIPQEECPFSRRLFETAQCVDDTQKKKDIIDYCAAHLLYIASLNIRAGRFDIADRLLHDDRCKRHVLRFYWWKLNYYLLQLKASSSF